MHTSDYKVLPYPFCSAIYFDIVYQSPQIFPKINIKNLYIISPLFIYLFFNDQKPLFSVSKETTVTHHLRLCTEANT